MFVDTIGTNDLKSNILDSIILFVKHAGLKVIAEGVETQAQVDYLASKRDLLNCRLSFCQTDAIR